MWRDILGYEGIYQISDNGQIKSLARKTPHGHSRKEFIMKQELDQDGYKKIGLTKENIQRRHLVSRLVALHFLRNPLRKPVVNHLDGDKLNNHVSNLEWATVTENNHHAVSINLRNGYQGSQNYNSKLTDDDVIKIKSMISEGVRMTDIAKIFRVSLGTISHIKQNRTWKHI